MWTITNSSGTFDVGSSEESGYLFSDDKLTLMILQVRRRDAGTYTVTVSNTAGTDAAEISLVVTGGT